MNASEEYGDRSPVPVVPSWRDQCRTVERESFSRAPVFTTEGKRIEFTGAGAEGRRETRRVGKTRGLVKNGIFPSLTPAEVPERKKPTALPGEGRGYRPWQGRPRGGA